MIETREAIGRLEQILDVAGIDAVYVGPADLAVTYGLPPGVDNPDPDYQDSAGARSCAVAAPGASRPASTRAAPSPPPGWRRASRW